MSKTTVIAVLTLVATVANVGVQVLTHGWSAVDWSLTIQTVLGALTALGFKLSADQ